MALNQAFTNFLGRTGEVTVRDYQHASQLYVGNNYAKTPKFGFLYFVTFSINPAVPLDQGTGSQIKKEVGLLVKKIDLPKFTLKTETINQYNRKTVIQTGLTYTNVNIDFHDDNSNLTRDLWTNYYRYYFMDSNYGTGINNELPQEFKDTKYGINNYIYGLNSYQSVPFFDSINIYVLHQHNFTQYTLVNPMVTDWNHDTLDQDVGTKILGNRMIVAYESVLYNKGQIVKGNSPEGFGAQYYDQTNSPIAVSENNNRSTPAGSNDVAGVPPGPDQTGDYPIDRFSSNQQLINNAIKSQSQLQDNATYDKNNYSVLDGVLGNLQSSGAGGYPTKPSLNAVQANLPINPSSAVDNRSIINATPSQINGSSTDNNFKTPGTTEFLFNNGVNSLGQQNSFMTVTYGDTASPAAVDPNLGWSI